MGSRTSIIVAFGDGFNLLLSRRGPICQRRSSGDVRSRFESMASSCQISGGVAHEEHIIDIDGVLSTLFDDLLDRVWTITGRG